MRTLLNRKGFQVLSNKRIKEAKQLIDSGSFEGAYYLAGYSIECALKACIAKLTRRHQFVPPPEFARDCYTHDLTRLLGLASLKGELDNSMKTNRALERNWGCVKDWTEQARYEVAKPELAVREFYNAIVSKPNGVLPWLKKYW